MASSPPDTHECDALIVGSGCAGMSAAVTAAHHGLNVLIVEKESRFGGTTARSGGWLWIPGTSLARAWGITEGPDQAKTYLRHEAGNSFDAARVDAFLTSGPEAVDFFTSKTAVRFDMPLLGERRGRRGVHLQCHIGTDTISLARLLGGAPRPDGKPRVRRVPPRRSPSRLPHSYARRAVKPS